MAKSSSLTLLLALSAALSLAIAGCASGEGSDAGSGGGMDSGPPGDGSVGDSSTPPRDSGGGTDGSMMMVDSGGGGECGGACDDFQYCDSGTCRDYPACRGDGTCDRPTDVCHNRRCVPMDVDIDGDGSPAGEDCDETDPDKFPGNPEQCNGIDENCNDMIDEGDPATLCESYLGGGICIAGSCGCPAGTFDLDRSIAGCECVAMPALDQGLSCESPIDLGNLSDTGTMMTVSGNVMPDDREVWYRFHAVDAADTACDNFHVRVLFTSNPGDTFELTVFRGDCATVGCTDSGFTDYSWATDFRQTVMDRLTGQCPCTGAGAALMTDVSVCEDDTADYFVRVRRRAGSVLACDPYRIEVSNGIYDTM